MRNHPIPQRRSLTKTLAIGLLTLAQVIAPVAHAETITYQHDNNGNITQRGTTTYIYDALNRLISESGPAKTQNFTYDANGNRLSDGSGVYTYAPTSNRMLTRRGLPVTLDAAGNITADGTGRTYVYNQAGQIAQVKQAGTLIASYYYNYRGLRTRKVTTASAPQGAQTILYVYDRWGKIIAEVSGSGTPLRTYIWRDNTPVAQIEHQPSRKIYYFTVDHLNMPRSMMDETGKIVWRWESDAFGSTLPNEDADGDGVRMTSNLRFPGQYYDQETGLHYNWHRYYDPTMGQYIQADPIGLDGGINPFTYVGGNPLRWIDPLGLEVTKWARPADLGPGGIVGLVVDHHWLKTDTQEGGMDPMTGEIPAQNGESSLPGVPVQTNDHTGQSKESNAKQIPIPFPVDEQCVNNFIRQGQALGKFGAANNCQTFADDVLNKCRIDPALGRPKRWMSGTIK